MSIKEEKIKEYLKSNQTIILTTVGKDASPDVRTLGGYGISEYEVFFSTSKESNKVKQLEQNKEVAILFQHENQLITDFFNVTIYGEAVLLDKPEDFEKAKEYISARKPSLKINTDTHNIYQVIPKKIKVLDFKEHNPKERVSIIEL